MPVPSLQTGKLRPGENVLEENALRKSGAGSRTHGLPEGAKTGEGLVLIKSPALPTSARPLLPARTPQAPLRTPGPACLRLPVTRWTTLGTRTCEPVTTCKELEAGKGYSALTTVTMPSTSWGRTAPLIQAQALEMLGVPCWSLSQGWGLRAGSVPKGHPGWWLDPRPPGLTGTGPGSKDLARRTEGSGEEATHFPSLCPSVESAHQGEEQWGSGSFIFLRNFPLGVGDGCGRLLGVTEPIFHTRSKVALI